MGDAIITATDSGKTQNAITSMIKQTATESLPAGDELASALSQSESMTLKEWLEFMGPPDILLDKEMCWPVEPEL